MNPLSNPIPTPTTQGTHHSPRWCFSLQYAVASSCRCPRPPGAGYHCSYPSLPRRLYFRAPVTWCLVPCCYIIHGEWGMWAQAVLGRGSDRLLQDGHMLCASYSTLHAPCTDSIPPPRLSHCKQPAHCPFCYKGGLSGRWVAASMVPFFSLLVLSQSF